MTAPTPGKGGRGSLRHPGSLPTLLLTLPSSFPDAARPGECGPPCPVLGADRPLPPRREVATSPSPDLVLPARSAPGPPAHRDLAAGVRGNPEPGGGGEGGRGTVPFQESQSLPGAPQRPWCRFSALPLCALPRTRAAPGAQGHRPGSSAAPSGVRGAGEVVTLPGRAREQEDTLWVRGRKGRLGSGPLGGREGKDRGGHGPRAIPGDPGEFSPKPRREAAEGRGLCVRACVRVSACERVRVQSR